MNDTRVRKREQVRLALKSSSLPLPDEVVRALSLLMRDDALSVLHDHPGYGLSERKASYYISLDVFQRSVAHLLRSITAFEALAQKNDLFGRLRETELTNLKLDIQKEVFATTNAAHSLVDHSRRLQKALKLDQYEERRREYFGDDGLHDFVIGLRVLLHHVRIVEVGWKLTIDYDAGTRKATFEIPKETIASAIEADSSSFGSTQMLSIENYIKRQLSIDLKVVFEEYRNRAGAFNAWLVETLDTASMELRDYERCIREHKNSSTRIQWKALLGNWLRNWKTPPDPYQHLARFLTAAQIEHIHKFPRASTEQVDAIIRMIDDDCACDAELRAMAYELFQRAPSNPAPPSLNSGPA